MAAFQASLSCVISRLVFFSLARAVYIHPPQYPPNVDAFMKEYGCLPPIGESRSLEKTPLNHRATNGLLEVLKRSAVNGTVMYIVVPDNEISEEGFEEHFWGNVKLWKKVLERYPRQVVAFTGDADYRNRLSAAGFRAFSDHDFFRDLYKQAGDESELRTFRLMALNEVILHAGYSSFYVDIGNSIKWTRDPFEQLAALDPEGEVFFSVDEFRPGTTEPAWGREPLVPMSSENEDEHACCGVKVLPWSNALMFTRPTSRALRLVRLMKERSVPVQDGGGGLCQNHEAHNLGLFEGCGNVPCRTLDPLILPSEATVVRGKYVAALDAQMKLQTAWASAGPTVDPSLDAQDL